LWDGQKEKDHYEDVNVSGRIIYTMDLTGMDSGGMD
jgi:hypothetical protein